MHFITSTRRKRTWLGIVFLLVCALISPVPVGGTAPSGTGTGNVSYGFSVGANHRYEDENLPDIGRSPQVDGDIYPDFIYMPADPDWMLHGKNVPPDGTWHGTFGATEGCEPTLGPVVEVYCDDSSAGLRTDACYELRGSVLPKVQWILSNYYPQTDEPAALPIDDKAVVVQEAIWHFTNGDAVVGVASDIVNAANNAGAELVTPWSLTFSQAEDLNPMGTQHTVTAELRDGDNTPIQGRTVHFTVVGMNPVSGTATTGSDGKATFTYTGTYPGTDVIKVQVSYVHLGALRWEYDLSNQGVIKADPHPEDLVEELTKRWEADWELFLPLVFSSR